MVMLYISASLRFWSLADPIAHEPCLREFCGTVTASEFAGRLALPAHKFQRRRSHVGDIRQPTHLLGFRNRSPNKPLLNRVDSVRVGSRNSHRRYALRLSRQDSPAPVAENAVGDFATDPQPKPPRAHDCGAFIRRKDRDRADSLAEEGPIGLPAERAARTQFAPVLISILDYDEQSEHAGGKSLLSQDPALMAEAWDHRGFGLQPSQAIPASSATRPAHVSASFPSRPHHPGDRRRPSGVPCIT